MVTRVSCVFLYIFFRKPQVDEGMIEVHGFTYSYIILSVFKVYVIAVFASALEEGKAFIHWQGRRPRVNRGDIWQSLKKLLQDKPM